MSAAVDCIHAVGKTQDRLTEAVVILQRNFYPDPVRCFSNVDWLLVDYSAVMVHVAHKTGQAALEIEGLFLVFSDVGDGDFQPFVEVGYLTHAFAQRIEIIFDRAEDLFIG